MSYNGSGVYIAPAGQPVVSGTVIQSSTFNSYVADVTATFNNTLTRDGQGVPTGPFKLFSGTVSVPGLSFNSESSTGMFWPSAGVLAFAVQGVEPMRLKTSGAVLIGTSIDDGTNRVQVNGTVKATTFLGNVTGNVAGNVTGALTGPVTGNVTGNVTGALTGNASTATTLQTARAINGIAFDGSAAITVADTTKLPLTGGTLSGALTVSGSFTGTAGLNVTGVGGVVNAVNKFGVDNNAGITRMYASGPNSATRGSYDFRITDSVGTLDQSAMVIDNTGNVGVGGSSAGGKLELLTASGDPYLRITNGTQQAFMQARGTSSLVAFGSLSNSDVAVYTNNTEKVRVDVSGNVGIGGTPVGAIGKLHVFGGITSTTGINVAGNGGFYNAANKFGVDNNVGATRMYASGPNSATKGSFELHGITSDGSIDTVHLTITAAGVIQDSAANELGFKGLPSASVTTGAFAAADRGKCVYATAGVTIPNATMAVGDVVTIINTTAAAITITATVTTLRQAGTANTGNRTLAAYGIATVIFVSSTLGFISGTGLT